MSTEDRDVQDIRNKIAFGLDCKVWMESQIGRYLTARANAQREAAMEALAEVDAEDAKAIREQQNQIKVAAMFLQWMGEAVTEGENAERAFIEGQD